MPLPSNQIEVVPAEPEPMGLDAPSLLDQMFDHDLLAGITAAMAWVGPF